MPKLWKGKQFIPEAFRKNYEEEQVSENTGNNIKGIEKAVEQMKNNLGIAVCPICGKQFVKSNPQSLYCSLECREEAKRISRQKYNMKKSGENVSTKDVMNIRKHNYKCAYCGRTFRGRNGAKFCSDKCRSEANREYQKEWYREKMKKIRGQVNVVEQKPVEQKPNEQKANEQKPNTPSISEKVNIVEQVIKATKIVQAVEEMKDEDFTHKVVKVIEML